MPFISKRSVPGKVAEEHLRVNQLTQARLQTTAQTKSDQFVTLGVTLGVPSVLWRCWLGGRKGIRPVKTEWWGAGMVICLERDADLHMAQLIPLPLTVSCFSKIQIGFTFLVPAHLGSPGKGPLNVCVCCYFR